MRSNQKLLALSACLMALCPMEVTGQCGPNGCFVGPSYQQPTYRQPQQTTVPTAVRGVLPSVARIVHRDASGVSLGSGTLIATQGGASYFLTCAHLFEGAGQSEVRLGGRSYPASLLAIDKRHDLALLRTQATNTTPAAIEHVEPTGLLSACGYGPSGQMRCVSGPITGYSTAVGAEAPSLRLRGAVRSGDSGGPVFNAAGRLVAVIWGQRGGETYAMSGGPLRRILARLPRSGGQAPPAATQPIPRAEPPRREIVAAKPSLPKDLARQGDLERLESAWEQRFDRLSNQVNVNLSTPPPVVPPLPVPAPEAAPSPRLGILRYAEPLMTALAVGGPLGVGLFAGRLWLKNRAKRRLGKRSTEPSSAKPVAVDTPPPPQQIVPETHYVSYERDEFAKAHQWACEQLARKFPGAVEMLASLDSLIKQQLNGDARR